MWTIIWIILAIVFVIIEANTLALASIWFAVGSLFAIITSVFIDGFIIPFLVFAIISFVCMIAIRPLAKKYLDKGENVKMNVDRFIGMEGFSTLDINSFDGEVKVDGKTWSARSEKEILKGKKIKVIKLEGVKLIVEEI